MKQRNAFRQRTPVRRFPLAATALVLGLLGFGPGCSENASEATSQSSLDACSLLTSADVTEVLGADAGDPQTKRHGDGVFWVANCNYNADTSSGLLTASLLLRPHHVADGAVQAYADYEAELIAELGPGAVLTPVEGIGERAGWQDFGTSLGQLTVFDGPYQFIVSVRAKADADQMISARLLAERVLTRLRTK